MIGQKVKVKPDHPHYPNVIGTVSYKSISEKLWWINELERVIPTKVPDKITASIALASDEFEVLA